MWIFLEVSSDMKGQTQDKDTRRETACVAEMNSKGKRGKSEVLAPVGEYYVPEITGALKRRKRSALLIWDMHTIIQNFRSI